MSIDVKERNQVLNLTQYFSDHWVILDVGSNKGEWSDIIINHRDSSTEHGKYTVHLFEPNELLLNFTRVKYDRNKRIVFNCIGVSNGNKTGVPFYYFTNENNGLSSLINNPKWDYLPKQKCLVSTITLDEYCKNLGDIDIIKIDVEGSDFDVLQGAQGLMMNKRVKFLQVEYSEHYQLTGKTFVDVIRLASFYGYNVWEWDGEYYQEVKEEYFKEDYRLDNFILTYLPIGRYHYTQDWNGEFKKNSNLLSPARFALEIGCFEGLTTNFICEHILLPGGRMIAVDPLTDEYLPGHSDNSIFKGQYERFVRNTKGKPVELLRMRSEEAWPLMKDYLFDLVYIDGDHTREAVYNDGVNAFKLLRRNGQILFDDYGWRKETAEGIDHFLNEYKDQIKIQLKEYQVLIRKK